jgi:hypothetical protein
VPACLMPWESHKLVHWYATDKHANFTGNTCRWHVCQRGQTCHVMLPRRQTFDTYANMPCDTYANMPCDTYANRGICKRVTRTQTKGYAHTCKHTSKTHMNTHVTISFIPSTPYLCFRVSSNARSLNGSANHGNMLTLLPGWMRECC